MEEQVQEPTHAYIIVYFKDGGEVKILSGRERALHDKAIERLNPKNIPAIMAIINKKEELLDTNGSNIKFKIFRNFSGVLLCGRTAMPGGKKEADETSAEAAIRELEEEFGLKGIQPENIEHLVTYPLDAKRCEIYYTLNLDTLNLKPQSIIDDFNKAPTTEKRLLEILTPTELVEKLSAPDEDDKRYIQAEMEKFSSLFCRTMEKKGQTKNKIPPDAENKLARDLYEYQIRRVFNAVSAAREFQKRFSSATSLKNQANLTLMPPVTEQKPLIPQPQKTAANSVLKK
jgi:ADP-ribose pyrophosphatase YjhB (NUDIX family)